MGIRHRSLSRSGETTPHQARFLVYGLLALSLMVLDQRGGYVDRIHALAREITDPALLLIEAPIRGAHHLNRWWVEQTGLMKERDQLVEQIRQSNARLLQMNALARENQELRSLLSLSEAIDQHFISARVLSIDLSPFSHRLIIDKGRVDGLTESMAVVDQGGLIGQIDTVATRTASIILITDPDHALPVRVERTDAVTLAYGGGLNNDLVLPDLPMNIDLMPGDMLTSSGLGGVFPAGLPVAIVDQVERPSGQSFAKALATPVGQHDRSRFVMVLQPRHAAPLNEAMDASASLDDVEPNTDG